MKPSIAPIATAVVGSTPLRWKNRMLTAHPPGGRGHREVDEAHRQLQHREPAERHLRGRQTRQCNGVGEARRHRDQESQEHEGEAGLAEGLGDGVEADVGEAGHERRTGDEEQHSHQHATPGETAKLLKISAFDASSLQGRSADVIDIDVGGGGVSAKAARQRSWLHVRRRVGEAFGSRARRALRPPRAPFRM